MGDSFRRKRWRRLGLIGLGGSLVVGWVGLSMPSPAQSPDLALGQDIPEEILRTEIITAARSPLDGSPMTAAAYAALQADLQTSDYPPTLSSGTRQIVFLLQIRRAIRTFFPFLLD